MILFTRLRELSDFNEWEHPRGQPENQGEFVKKGEEKAPTSNEVPGKEAKKPSKKVSSKGAQPVRIMQARKVDVTAPLGSNAKEQALTVRDMLSDAVSPKKLGSVNINDAATELQGRSERALRDLGVAGGVIGGPHPYTDALISRAIASEILDVVRRGEVSSLDWYTSKFTKAMKVAALLHPELANDELKRTAFIACMAITSQGEDPSSNTRLAEKAYADYKASGYKTFPHVSAHMQIAMNANFDKLNALVDKLGMQGAHDFLNCKAKVSDLMKAGYKNLGKETVNNEVYGSTIFGSKIGQGFFANLSGHFDPITADLWFMRAWGRLTGTLVGSVDITESRKRFETLLGETAPKTLPALLIRAKEIAKQSQREFEKNRAAYQAGTWRKTPLMLAAEALHNNALGTKDQPSGGWELNWIRNRINSARELLAQQGISITNADLQACWWYPEKNLYRKMGVREREQVSLDFAETLSRMAKARGISEQDIAEAVASEKETWRLPEEGQYPWLDDAEPDPSDDMTLEEFEQFLEKFIELQKTDSAQITSSLRTILREIATYDPNEPRDKVGKWTKGAGGGDKTQTLEFKRWFGDSKAVNEKGEPLIVYHASTYGDFDTFSKEDQRKGLAGYGFYFSDQNGANEYFRYGDKFQYSVSWRGDPKRLNILPVYLKMEKPLYIDDIRKLADGLHGQSDPGHLGVGRSVGKMGTDAKTWLQRAGYDGVIGYEYIKRGRDGHINVVDAKTKGAIKTPVHVVFEPNQIKSATGNKGTFDPDDAKITARLRELSSLGEVYHYTGIHNVYDVLSEGKFRLTSTTGVKAEEEIKGANKRIYYLSLTRSKVGGYHTRAIGNYGCVLALDADELQHHAQLKPVDYWGPEARKVDQKWNEMEERLFSKQQYLKLTPKMIHGVHLLMKGEYTRPSEFKMFGEPDKVVPIDKEEDKRYASIIRKTLILAKAQHVPMYVYDNVKDWLSERPERAVPIHKIIDRLKGEESPGYQRKPTNWLKPYLELYYAPRRDKLSKKALNRLSAIKYYAYERERLLDADLHNERNQPHIASINKLILKHGSVAKFLEHLEQRWDAIDKEQDWWDKLSYEQQVEYTKQHKTKLRPHRRLEAASLMDRLRELACEER